MIEIDIRKAGSGCVDNPVVVLSDYLSKGIPLKIILRKDQLGLVKEMLELAEYRLVEEKTVGDEVFLVAKK